MAFRKFQGSKSLLLVQIKCLGTTLQRSRTKEYWNIKKEKITRIWNLRGVPFIYLKFYMSLILLDKNKIWGYKSIIIWNQFPWIPWKLEHLYKPNISCHCKLNFFLAWPYMNSLMFWWPVCNVVGRNPKLQINGNGILNLTLSHNPPSECWYLEYP